MSRVKRHVVCYKAKRANEGLYVDCVHTDEPNTIGGRMNRDVIATGYLDGERIEIVRVFNNGAGVFIELADGRTDLLDAVSLLQWRA